MVTVLCFDFDTCDVCETEMTQEEAQETVKLMAEKEHITKLSDDNGTTTIFYSSRTNRLVVLCN